MAKIISNTFQIDIYLYFGVMWYEKKMGNESKPNKEKKV